MPGVLAWVCLGAGSLLVIQSLIRLTIGRAKPDMTEPGGRRWAFATMGSGLLTVSIGLLGAPRYGAAEWATRLAGFGLMGFAAAWWFRSRLPARSTSEPPEAGQRPDPSA